MNKKLNEINNFLKNKKIAIIGAGVSNIPLIEYLSKLTNNLTLFDKKELNNEVKELVNKYNVKTSIGENYLESLIGYDVIFRSPSCLPTNKYLIEEQKRGALVTTEIEQVLRLAPCKTIGITGSKGKTTTTTLISLILKEHGFNVHVGGNIGTPIFTKLNEIKENDIIVLELSSFQLMNMQVSPNIAVITNISPDHLDVHANYQEYIDAKKSIFTNQTSNDIVVLNMDDKIVKDFSKDAKGEVRYFSSTYIKDSYVLNNDFIEYNHEKIIDTKNIKIKGSHNYLNICAMLNALKDYIDIDKVKKVLQEFNGVEHRLEYIRTIDNVEWYNDSASTSPDKAKGAIFAFDKDVTLIAGGYDKNLDYTPLAEYILQSKINKVVLFGQTKNKIKDALTQLDINNKIELYVLDNLDEVITKAREITKPNSIILFSPASASFDMFKSAYQRGDIFKEKVNNLK